MGVSWTLLSLALLAFLAAASNKIRVREFCETEAFNATCDHDEVILMQHARYGRMRVGRCVKLDYGHVGCANDVLGLADTRCSGQRNCQIRIPDALFAKTKPCPDDLKPYLEATYNCVKVAVPMEERCHLKERRVLEADEGYLASIVTQETGCGTVSLPWHIHVRSGQRINVSLLDFGIAKKDPTLALNSQNQCKVYAIIRERMVNRIRNITVCGSVQREKNVYLSMTSQLEIALIPGEQTDSSPSFMISYRATGCPDILPPALGWVHRSDDKVVITCNYTRESWHLKCINDQWVGDRGNCSEGALLRPTSATKSEHPLSYGSSILIIIAVALTIGLVVLVLGLVCLKKRRRLCFGEVTSLEASDLQEEKCERTYSTHYQWTKKPNNLSPGKEPAIGSIRIENVEDIYNFSHIHPDTQPCTPLLKNSRDNTIYGQALRCTCPHTYGRAGAPARRDGIRSATVEGEGTSRVGSHYFVLDPDVIADNRSGPQVQFRTFGQPSKSAVNQEELYPMCTIKHPLSRAPVGHGVPGECPPREPLYACRNPVAPPAPCPHKGQASAASGSHEDLENSENERRKPENT